ncbi:MAG: response regulator [Anaerolineae bacterium]
MHNRILVVEDDQATRNLLTETLLDTGYSVYAVSNEAALLQFGLVQPDLIILEILETEPDRWRALHRIRELSSIPIIALVPAESEGAEVESLDRGADQYVTKPFGAQEVQARVQALLRRNQWQRRVSGLNHY